MNIKELFNNYNTKHSAYAAKMHQLEVKKAKIEGQIDKLELKRPMLFDEIIVKLAKELQKATNLKYYEIYGPFGLECEMSIYLSNYGKKNSIDICNVDTYKISIKWGPDDTLLYWNGQTTNEYSKGSIGYYNGLNRVYVELPNEIENIVKLLTFSSKKEKNN